MSKINVISKRIGGSYKLEEIDNDLKAMQKLVGGYIECVKLKNGFVLVCDEEGRLKEKAHNDFIKLSGVYKSIRGDFFITKALGDKFISINLHSENEYDQGMKLYSLISILKSGV